MFFQTGPAVVNHHHPIVEACHRRDFRCQGGIAIIVVIMLNFITTWKVFVLSRYDICERKDVHRCQEPGVCKRHCVQLILTLPHRTKASLRVPAITRLITGGYPDPLKYLVAADELGYLTIWTMPPFEQGLEYSPLKSLQAHQHGINIMVSLFYHRWNNRTLISLAYHLEVSFYRMQWRSHSGKDMAREWFITSSPSLDEEYSHRRLGATSYTVCQSRCRAQH